MVVRSSGGVGMISNCTIDLGRCRIAVPRQSAPVSPPPMITTCLFLAVIWSSHLAARTLSDWLVAGNSIA